MISHDPPNRLVVDIPSAQVLGLGVRMLIHGPADGVRVNHAALPGRGTWGIVVFPYGDPRNGLWIGSFYPSQQTAYTSIDDPFLEYNSHFSGAYETLDQTGQWTKSFPDGTFIQVSGVSASVAKPAMHRQTVDPQQNQKLTPFTDGQRVPNKPAPRTLTIHHATGASVVIDDQGNVIVSSAQGKNVTVVSDTEIDVTAPLVKLTGDLHVTGEVVAGFGGSDQVGLQSHVHGHGTAAAGTTTPSAGS